MSNLFSRLNYNYNDTSGAVDEYSSNTKSFMEKFPAVLTDWQLQDIENNDTQGYLQNSLATIIINTDSSATSLVTLRNSLPGNTLYGNTTSITTEFSTLFTSANNLSKVGGTCELFKNHTDRISGVRTIEDDIDDGYENTDEFSYFNTASGTGKALSFILYQTDGIQNNAPIMGNFTSLLEGDNLTSLYNELSTYHSTINSSITLNLISGSEPPVYQATSNLSLAVVSSMSNTVTQIQNIMNTRMTHDIDFYMNSRQLLSEVTYMRNYTSGMGETDKMLYNNYIGTTKLKTRINS